LQQLSIGNFRSKVVTRVKRASAVSSTNSSIRRIWPYLARDLPAVKDRCRRKLRLIWGQWMNIYGKQLLMPLEKSLPKGCQRQWSLGQEHECNLGNSRIWIILDPWNKRSPPQQFFVTHVVDQAQRWSNPLIQTTMFLIITWLKIRTHCSRYTLNSKMLNCVYANDRKHNTERKKQHK